MTATLRTALIAAILLGGCSTDPPCDNCPPPATGQETPTQVVAALVQAYKDQDIEAYARLLADDFRFIFDVNTRPVGTPAYWTRLQDSTATGNLFRDPTLTDIRIDLAYGLDTPADGAGHESWRKIVVTDTFLEIDTMPAGYAEGVTFRIDGDQQQFLLRQGRTPADTLASSTTSQLWHLVEWRDQGRLQLGAAAAWPVSEAATWGRIKARYGT